MTGRFGAVDRRRWLIGLAGLALTGCESVLTKPFPEKRSYILTARRPARLPSPANDLVLGVRRFRAGSGYEGRGLVTKIDSVSVRQDFYNEFFVAPTNLIEDLAGTWLADSGLFRQVAPALGQELPTHALEGTLTSLYGDFSQGGAGGQAVVDLQLLVLEIRRAPGAVVAQQNYRRVVPVADRSAETLIAAWNRSLTDIMTDFETRVRQGLAAR
jgi:cholesterol transport system auxiliary component